MKVFSKNIISQREDALAFVKEHIKLHAEIKGTERVESWEYPIEAIREAITNAICHRDYESTANVQIRIFDDRIEIWNPGKLLDGLSVEKLKQKHESIPRSPLLANNFFLIKYIEQWGTGTNRMVEWCQNYDLPEPIFEEVNESFVVTFRKSKLTDEYLITQKLNERQRKAIEYLRQHRYIANKEYRKINEVGKVVSAKELNLMVEKDILRRIGKGRMVRYELND